MDTPPWSAFIATSEALVAGANVRLLDGRDERLPLLSSVSPGSLGLRISPASLFRFALPVKAT